MPVTHKFVDAHADGADATLVRPSNWNDTHTVAIGIADLTASGTPSSSTYLRGDNTWAAVSGSGTVTTVSVVSANGFAGTVATSTSTPAITLTTSITGLLKGDGTAISAATSGTDYAPATSGSSILYGNGSGGFSNVTIGTGISFIAGTLSASGTAGVSSITGDGTYITNVASTGAVTLTTTFGTAAQKAIGTSGATVPLLNGANTWSGTQTLSAVNLATDTTTGMQIATASNQKIGFYGTTPVIQQSGNALTALSTLGLIATPTLTATNVGLGSVTNDAQTKAAIVPNTAPSAGQYLVGNAGGTAYAPVTMSGSGATITQSSAGVVTISAIANASLTNSSITIAGTSTALGGAITQDTITGLASTGIVKRTAANTLGIAAAGTDYQAPLTLTTTGSSGAATLISNTLNIPQYTGGGSVPQSIINTFG